MGAGLRGSVRATQIMGLYRKSASAYIMSHSHSAARGRAVMYPLLFGALENQFSFTHALQ